MYPKSDVSMLFVVAVVLALVAVSIPGRAAAYVSYALRPIERDVAEFSLNEVRPIVDPPAIAPAAVSTPQGPRYSAENAEERDVGLLDRVNAVPVRTAEEAPSWKRLSNERMVPDEGVIDQPLSATDKAMLAFATEDKAGNSVIPADILSPEEAAYIQRAGERTSWVVQPANSTAVELYRAGEREELTGNLSVPDGDFSAEEAHLLQRAGERQSYVVRPGAEPVFVYHESERWANAGVTSMPPAYAEPPYGPR